MMYIDDGINDRGINYNVIVGSVLKKIIQISILSSVAFFSLFDVRKLISAIFNEQSRLHLVSSLHEALFVLSA